jgi:hypothetical protein
VSSFSGGPTVTNSPRRAAFIASMVSSLGTSIRLAVDQDEVRLDVAVAVIVPLATERVIEIPPGQRLVLRQQGHSFLQIGVETLAMKRAVDSAKAVRESCRDSRLMCCPS